jgi:hypothetical protein
MRPLTVPDAENVILALQESAANKGEFRLCRARAFGRGRGRRWAPMQPGPAGTDAASGCLATYAILRWANRGPPSPGEDTG